MTTDMRRKGMGCPRKFPFQPRIHESIMALPRDDPDRAQKADLIRAHIPEHLWDVTLKDYGRPTEARRGVEVYCQKIDQAAKEGYGLLLCGPDRRGKDILIAVTLKEAIRRGHSAFYLTLSELMAFTHHTRDYPGDTPELLAIREDTMFLAIGELETDGDGPGLSKFALSELEYIVRNRRGRLLPTLLETAVTETELKEVYGGSMISVVSARTPILKTDGEPPLNGKKGGKSSNEGQFRPCLKLLLAPPGKQPEAVRQQLVRLGDLGNAAHLIVAEARKRGLSEEEASELLERFYTERFSGLGEAFLASKVGGYVRWGYGTGQLPIKCSTVGNRAPWLCEAAKQLASDGNCPFPAKEKAEAEARRAEQAGDDRFEALGWPGFFREQYELGPLAAHLYGVFLGLMGEDSLDYSDTLLVGYRELTRMAKETGYSGANRSQVQRAVKLLLDHGLLMKVAQGKPGTNSGKANGYRIVLPTPRPPEPKSGPRGGDE